MRTRLSTQFPANREINRDFDLFRVSYGYYASVLNDLARNSLRDGTGNFLKRTANFLGANREARHTNDNFIALIRDSMARPEHKLFEIRSG
jgi:hypothetical protein